MKFLKFPTLIQLEILHFLDPFEYFLLSLCSRKTRKCVKRLEYKNTEIWIQEDESFFSFSLRTQKSCLFLFHAFVKSLRTSGNRKTNIEQNGQLTKYFWKTLEINQCVFDVATEECVRIVYKCICDLFNEPLNGVYFHEIKQIRQRSYTFGNNIKRSIFRNYGSLTWEDLEEFYTQFPDQEYSEIYGEANMDNSDFSINHKWKDQKIMKIKNLVIWNTGKQPTQFLMHFKGEHGLFMRCDYLTSFGFNKFLKNWINGENGKNLKSICFFPKPHSFDFNEMEIFEGIRIHKTENSVQMDFGYGPLIEKYDEYLPRCDFSNGAKIERKSDRKLATVFCTELYFALFSF
ncbi:unnamed protein product [Caenorhabditis nigoni]